MTTRSARVSLVTRFWRANVLPLWRRLISMRTALILLFLLALGAVPGSLLPQRPLNATKVTSYLASHGAWGTFLDHLGMFDVFGSVWFAAIYLLLFVSLVGCLVPRIRVHARAMMARPLKAPRNLDRLPEHASFTTTTSVADYSDTARRVLGRRWRVERREEPGGALTLSAEKGYSRETGNLVFHVALVCALVLIAVGRLYSYESTYLVEQGAGFCNGAFPDQNHPGRFAAEGKVTPPPFCVHLNTFTATYLADGQPSEFLADVSYEPNADSPAHRAERISVNHPLRVQGDRVYLVGHGYSPMVSVKLPSGKTYQATADFTPTDPATLLSEGAFKITQPSGTGEVGIEGVFAPTPAANDTGAITSISPQVSDPVLAIFVYTGTLDPDGTAESTNSLDKRELTRIGQANLRVGQSITDKGVTVTFTGWKPWVTFQVSHDPAQSWLLLAAGAMVIGLIGSLTVRRRRVWLRLTPATPATSGSDGSSTVVAVGGLARSDTGNFTTEFATLWRRLASAADTEPGTGVGAGVGAGPPAQERIDEPAQSLEQQSSEQQSLEQTNERQ